MSDIIIQNTKTIQVTSGSFYQLQYVTQLDALQKQLSHSEFTLQVFQCINNIKNILCSFNWAANVNRTIHANYHEKFSPTFVATFINADSVERKLYIAEYPDTHWKIYWHEVYFASFTITLCKNQKNHLIRSTKNNSFRSQNGRRSAVACV